MRIVSPDTFSGVCSYNGLSAASPVSTQRSLMCRGENAGTFYKPCRSLTLTEVFVKGLHCEKGAKKHCTARYNFIRAANKASRNADTC